MRLFELLVDLSPNVGIVLTENSKPINKDPVKKDDPLFMPYYSAIVRIIDISYRLEGNGLIAVLGIDI